MSTENIYVSKRGKPVSLEYVLGQPGVRELTPGSPIPELELECSTAGDAQFSAFNAYISVYGTVANIEYHYQTSKMFRKMGTDGNYIRDPYTGDFVLEQVSTWKDAKGRKPEKIKIGELILDKSFLSQWYKLLWLKYLDENPLLADYLQNFHSFTDKFSKSTSLNSQSDVLAQYAFEGRNSLMKDCETLFNILAQQKRIDEQYEEEHEELNDNWAEGMASWDMSSHL